MTGPQHYREAERLSDEIRNASAEALNDGQYVMSVLAAAQVHATLALAAATALVKDSRVVSPEQQSREYQDWHKAAGVRS